jgi:hypothetical protein
VGGEQTHRLFVVPIFVLPIGCPMRDLDASYWCLIFMPEVLEMPTGLDV